MRSVVLTATLATTLWVAAPPRAAAQDPEPTPPAPTRDTAVPRAERIRMREAEPSREASAQDEGRRRAAVPESRETRASAASDEQGAQRRGAVRRPPSDSGATRGGTREGGAREAGRRGDGGTRGDTADGARTRDRAVPRTSAPRPPQRVYVYPSYGRYYDRYDPWGYGGLGLGYFYFSPWGFSPYYSSPAYAYRYGGGYGGYDYDVGSVKLKVRPRDAEVYVDNYFAGYVDDFDGVFQALKVETGGHRIEIRKPGFEPLHFDVHVQPERSVTFRGEMKPAIP